MREAGFIETPRLGLNLAVHVEVDWQQNQSGIFCDSSRRDDWSDEWWRRRTEARRWTMLRARAQTEVNRANKSNYSDCLPNLGPILLQEEEHCSNHGEK